jgi:MoaA/NifB/PqqE/SkfB family radical SAM enzyme
VIGGEEAFLSERFPEFAEYKRRVPWLLPRLSSSGTSSQTFSFELYCKHREYNATLGSVVMFAALMAKRLWILR